MKMISAGTAIERLKKYCKENGYVIISKDISSAKFKDNILSLDITPDEILDRYIVNGFYSGAQTTKAEGSLLEMMHDFDLMAQDEQLEMGFIEGAVGNFTQRRSSVRLPWLRTRD